MDTELGFINFTKWNKLAPFIKVSEKEKKKKEKKCQDPSNEPTENIQNPSDELIKNLKDSLLEELLMPSPLLMISVIGGAKMFETINKVRDSDSDSEDSDSPKKEEKKKKSKSLKNLLKENIKVKKDNLLHEAKKENDKEDYKTRMDTLGTEIVDTLISGISYLKEWNFQETRDIKEKTMELIEAAKNNNRHLTETTISAIIDILIDTVISKQLKETINDIIRVRDTWVITEGLNVGVTKLVSSAVKEKEELSTLNKFRTQVLGIVSLDEGKNKEIFKPKNDEPIDHRHVKIDSTNKALCLDENHTHFIFVGKRNKKKFCQETKLRAELEKYISDKTSSPLVRLVIGGDYHTIQAAREAIENEIPIIVLEGTGGAADCIAAAVTCTENNPNYFEIVKKYIKYSTEDLKSCGEVLSTEDLKGCQQALKNICGNHKLVTISKNSNIKEMLLLALVKPDWSDDLKNNKRETDETVGHWEELTERPKIWADAVNLAIQLNIDRILEKLFQNMPKKLHKQFLTVDQLKNLYRYSSPTIKTLAKLDNQTDTDHSNTTDLKNIDTLVLEMTKEKISHLYDRPHGEIEDELEKMPMKHLFLWAVINKERELAMTFWKNGIDHMTSALVAAEIANGLSEEIENRGFPEGEQKDYKVFSEDQEKLATGISSMAMETDQESAFELLQRETKSWNHKSAIDLASDKHFMKQNACAKYFKTLLMKNLHIDTSWWKILLRIFCPLLMFSCFKPLKFQMIVKDQNQKKKEKRRTFLPTFPSFCCKKNNETNDMRLPFYTALWCFYEAPVVIFLHNILSFIGFLAIYSVFLLLYLDPVSNFDLNTGNALEIYIWIHAGTLLLDEVRQFAITPDGIFNDGPTTDGPAKNNSATGVTADNNSTTDGPAKNNSTTGVTAENNSTTDGTAKDDSTKDGICKNDSTYRHTSLYRKCQNYLKSFWNVLDIFSCHVVLILAIVLRSTLNENSFIWARATYCLGLFAYSHRFLQFFHMFEKFGVKVLIMKQMFWDLMVIVAVVVPLVLSHGVILHSLLFTNPRQIALDIHNMSPWPWYRSMFQIFGEPFLEDIEANWFATTFTLIYLVIVQLMMLNLLIAMFTKTYDRIEKHSTKEWWDHQRLLIEEYRNKPVLAPPLIIISLLLQLIKQFQGCCKCQKCNSKRDPSDNRHEKEIFKGTGIYVQIYDFGYYETFSTFTSNLSSEKREKFEKIFAEHITKGFGKDLDQQTQKIDDINEEMKDISKSSLKINTAVEELFTEVGQQTHSLKSNQKNLYASLQKKLTKQGKENLEKHKEQASEIQNLQQSVLNNQIKIQSLKQSVLKNQEEIKNLHDSLLKNQTKEMQSLRGTVLENQEEIKRLHDLQTKEMQSIRDLLEKLKQTRKKKGTLPPVWNQVYKKRLIKGQKNATQAMMVHVQQSYRTHRNKHMYRLGPID